MQMTSGRATTLLVGFPFVLAAAGWGGFQMVGYFAQATEHHTSTYSWDGGAVSISTSSGHVHVVAGDTARVEVSYTERYQLKKPTVVATPQDGGLRLTAKCPAALLSNNCDISFDVTVPASAQVDAHTGDGGVSVADTTGGVSVSTGDGGISLDGVRGPVVAHTGDGGIGATRLGSASVTATTGDGGISLRWSAAPTDVNVQTGDGGIALQLPPGSGPYDVSTHTGDGGRHIGVSTDPNARAKITARTGDGGIAVEYAASSS